MRNPWQGDGSSRRGRRGSDRPGAPLGGSPYDFTAENEERVDPVDLLAIRADDELLDALAAGRPVGLSTFGGPALDRPFDDGYNDDQQVLAMLQAWRTDVEAEPFPEMISIEAASEAIVAGQRAARPKRRLVPVAAAAAVAVMALSGVAIGASNAQPGDPLWGVSTLLNGNRAKSVEAAYRVNLALAAAQQALAEGRPAEAKAALAGVGPDLQNVKDPQRREELSRKSTNLQDTAEATTEGEKVETREDGSPKDADKAREQQKRRQGGSRSSNPSSGSSGSTGETGSGGSSGSGGSERPGGGGQVYDPRFVNPMPNPDPRSGGGWPMPNPANPMPNPSNFPMPNPANPMPFPANPNPGFPGFPGMPGFPGDPRARESQKPSEPVRPAPEPAKPSERPAPESAKPSEPQRPAPDQKPAPESKPATDTTKQPADNKQRGRTPEGDGGANNGGANNGGANNGGANNGGGDQRQPSNDKPRGGQSRGGHAENFMAPVRPYPTEAGPAAPAQQPPPNHDARPQPSS